MLIQFTVGNYRSFKERVTFSMLAADLDDADKKANNVFETKEKLNLLKSAAVYGANASGKSNLARAISFMKWFILNSFGFTKSTEKINVEPFKLSSLSEKEPSYFELVFLMGGRRYRYGFEINRDRVVSEWLFDVPTKKERTLFTREGSTINARKVYTGDIIPGTVLETVTKQNTLCLSVSAQLNIKFAKKILEWFHEKLNIISGMDDRDYFQYTVECCVNNKNRIDIIQLVKKLDLQIDEIHVEQEDVTVDALLNDFPDEIIGFLAKVGGMKATLISTTHKKTDESDNFILTEKFSLDHHESEGTRKIFALAGLLVTTLKEGKILVIDEFDARLHPLLSRAIVELFNSNKTNPNNAQLIFMTHDTNLLTNKLFRRDQIWFTEKNRYGVTDLYSLAEYKMSSDTSFEKDYIQGRYGAIPYIGDLSNLITKNMEKKNG